MWRKECNGVCFNGSCLFFFLSSSFTRGSSLRALAVYTGYRDLILSILFLLLWDGLYNRGVLPAGLFLLCFVLLLKPSSASFGVRYCFPAFLFFLPRLVRDGGEGAEEWAGLTWMGAGLGKCRSRKGAWLGLSTWFTSRSSMLAVSCSYFLCRKSL